MPPSQPQDASPEPGSTAPRAPLSTRNPLLRILPPVVYMALVFALSHSPRPFTPDVLVYVSDKVLHAAEYAPLGFLWARVFRGSPRRRLLLGWAAAVLFGLTDEFHQAFVPAREASLLDWAADAVGSLAGACGAVLLSSRHGEKK